LLEIAPYIVSEFAEYVILNIKLINYLLELREHADQQKNFELLNMVDESPELSINSIMDDFNFQGSLIYFLVKRIAINHPLYEAVPDQYYQFGQTKFKIVIDGQIIEDAWVNADFLDRLRNELLAQHKLDIEDQIEKRLRNLPLYQLIALSLLSGSEAFTQVYSEN